MEIIIRGKAESDKSTMAVFIKQALMECGFSQVSVEDGALVADFFEETRQGTRLNAIADKPVFITTENDNKAK